MANDNKRVTELATGAESMEPTPPPFERVDISHLSGTQRAAIFMMYLDEPVAREIFGVLSEAEIRKVGEVIVELEHVDARALATLAVVRRGMNARGKGSVGPGSHDVSRLRGHALKSAFRGYLGIGGIDRRHAIVGDAQELFRNASRDQPVGVVFRDQAAIVATRLVVGGGRLEPKNQIGIRPLAGVSGQEPVEFSRLQSEDLRDAGEIGDLVFVNHAIRLGDVKQHVEDIDPDFHVVGKQARKPCRIDLEAGDILLGEVEEARHIALLAARNLEHIEKGDFLVARHHAVRLGHLCRERDHRDGEGDRSLSAPAPRGSHIAYQPIDGLHAALTDRLDDDAYSFPDRHGAGFQTGRAMPPETLLSLMPSLPAPRRRFDSS